MVPYALDLIRAESVTARIAGCFVVTRMVKTSTFWEQTALFAAWADILQRINGFMMLADATGTATTSDETKEIRVLRTSAAITVVTMRAYSEEVDAHQYNIEVNILPMLPAIFAIEHAAALSVPSLCVQLINVLDFMLGRCFDISGQDNHLIPPFWAASYAIISLPDAHHSYVLHP
jgi:hypothetical protein